MTLFKLKFSHYHKVCIPFILCILFYEINASWIDWEGIHIYYSDLECSYNIKIKDSVETIFEYNKLLLKDMIL